MCLKLFLILDAISDTILESTPPLRKVPKGTISNHSFFNGFSYNKTL